MMDRTSTATHPANPLRIAIAGAGKMALNHVQAVGRTGSAEVVAVADPSTEALGRIRTAHPGLRTYHDLDTLLGAEQIDIVHVVSPPETHAALARQALEHGVHVYVEKPFAATSREARELLELAAGRDLVVCAGHQLLFEPPTRRVEALLPALGRIVHVESYFSFRTVRHTPGGRAPLRPDLQLLDILPHPVYLLLHILERAGEGPVEMAALIPGREGTVHALIRRGRATGTLVVTLEGRPVESHLRLVGSNGSLFADYVRGTVQRSIGPGTSGIDKLIAPYRQARQLLFGTTAALGRRFLRRQRTYPGLAELFSVFYTAVRENSEPPLSPQSIEDTVRICEEITAVLERGRATPRQTLWSRPMGGRGVLVTGGTGFLGREVVQALLGRERPVRVVARREPPDWERIPGVEYVVGDIAEGLTPGHLAGIEAVVHCAAETAGGWEEHQRNSLDATERAVRAAAVAGIARFLHVSSLAVLAVPRRGSITDDHPLEPDSRGSGPYVWGKLESERRAVEVGRAEGVDVKVVRPGALVDYRDFDPPGRLGKRLGNLFVAVGSPGHQLGTTEVRFAAGVMAWMVDQWNEAPVVVNLLDPELPTKRDLLLRLRQSNPDLTVVWLPSVLLIPLSWAATLLQKLLRPGRPAINVAKVFSVPSYDTSRSRDLALRLGEGRPSAALTAR